MVLQAETLKGFGGESALSYRVPATRVFATAPGAAAATAPDSRRPPDRRSRRFTEANTIASAWYNCAAMSQVPTGELESLPLRVHAFLAGVPLHDAWAVELPRWRAGITLDEFLRATSSRVFRPSPIVRLLLAIRFGIGRLFGWDREQARSARDSFASRLTAADTSRSLVRPGSPRGLFHMVYRFENEELLELRNRTAHAGALSALIETADAYRFYFGVYVRPVGRFTPLYMAAIGPFRRLIIYPSLLRSVRASWDRAFRPPPGR